MFAFRDLVDRNLNELSRIIAGEHGKVLADAKGEVIRGMEVVEYVAGIPELLKGEFSEQVSTNVDAYSFRQPLGVCAGITPAILDHPDIAAVSFVGSTPIARYIHQRASAAGKRVQALGGAKRLPVRRQAYIHGPEGVRSYTHAKAITRGWPDVHYAEHDRAHMHFPTAV
jgi:acyl-CoA reductase-like NAD-dependent aldehyde dehydrogenase